VGWAAVAANTMLAANGGAALAAFWMIALGATRTQVRQTLHTYVQKYFLKVICSY